jgi:hypothetical protein
MTGVTFMDVVRAQLRLALRARTVYFLLAMSVLPWAFIILIYKLATDGKDFSGSVTSDMLISPVSAVYCLVLGAMWGVLAWRDEPPKTRFYHWSLPVDMTTHDAARLVAYLVWLFAGMTAYIACGLVLLVANDVPLRLAVAGPMPWIASYVCGVIGFMMTAAISTAMNRPVEYIAGIFVGIWALALLSVAYRFDTLLNVLATLFGTRTHYSFGSAIIQGGMVGMSRYRGATGRYDLVPSNMQVIAPLILWFTIALAGVVAASLVNRGRAK